VRLTLCPIGGNRCRPVSLRPKAQRQL
jgi:hypothetical protein